MSLPVAQILSRPALWLEAVRAYWSMRRRGSFSPNHEYLAWRSHTAYGTADHPITPEDLEAYLTWRRRQRRLSR